MDNIKQKSEEETEKTVVIEGITEEGHAFRPSDWAERVGGNLATFKDCRLHYSPLLMPSTTDEGNRCVILDPILKQTNPELYESLLAFAKTNHLKICRE
jgi:hypothetical protein